MAGYPTVPNPLLVPSPRSTQGLSSRSFRNFFSRSFHQLSQTGSQIRLAATGSSTKRVGPSVSLNTTRDCMMMDAKKKSNTRNKLVSTTPLTRSARNNNADPLVHYNGPCDTLDQLPEEKLEWVKREPVEAEGLRHPLVGCPKSIVLRKPVTRSQTFPFVNEHVHIAAPKATFYLRVIQIVHHNIRKSCSFRCSVQVGKSICTGQVVSSEKCGKHTLQAEMDETFLFDIDQPSTAVLKISAQPKSTPRVGFGRRHQEETVTIGHKEFHVPVQASEKQLRRMTLEETPGCQVLVIYGTFVSTSAQVLLDNKCIHDGYITVYIRGQFTPKWERFWAALHGTVLLLYDFEYRTSRPPLYTIPLDFFVQVSCPSADDERRVDVGPLGLALQFTEPALTTYDLRRLEDEADDFECRMYVLPDSAEASRRWQEAFAYVASLLDQYRQTGYDADNDDSTTTSFFSYRSSTIMDYEGEENENGRGSFGMVIEDEDEEGPMTVPSKFMW